MNKLSRLNKDTRGATMVEYVVIVTLVFIAALIAWQNLGKAVKDKTQKAADSLNAVN